MLAKLAVGVLIIGFIGSPVLMALGLAAYSCLAGLPLWVLLGALTWAAWRLLPSGAEDGQE